MARSLLTIIFTLTLLTNVLGFVQKKELIARTGSVLPTIPINSTLVVDESAYAATDPKRLDIVLVKRKFVQPEETSPITYQLVATVIGLPGEKIWRAGRVYINGRKINELFPIKQCPKAVDEIPCGDMKQLSIPSGEYFLLADNRAESEDSRLWSPQTIRRSEVVGKVIKIEPQETGVLGSLMIRHSILVSSVGSESCLI